MKNIIERSFLGWDKAILPTAMDKLIELYPSFDFRDVVVVLSVRFAGIRILELLAERAEGAGIVWYPPEVITFGVLPEKFYEQTKPIANEPTRIFAWVEALKSMPRELSGMLPLLPDDIDGQRRLGEMFMRLHYELTADDLDFIKVAEKCRELKLGDEVRRWNLLADLQKEYHNILDSLNIWDRFSAVRFAINEQNNKERDRILQQNAGKRFFLLGVTDMNKLHKDILKKYGQFFTAFIFAPDEDKFHKMFDEFGCLVSDKWLREAVQISGEQIEVVLDDAEQADEVMRVISAWKNSGQINTSDDVVIGVPDVKIIPFLEERFERAGQEIGYVRGQQLRQTEVFRFIEVLAEVSAGTIGGLTYRQFAELLRHPSVNSYIKSEQDTLKSKNPDSQSQNHKPIVSEELLVLLDNYYNDHLPENVNENWLPNILNESANEQNQENIAKLREVWEKVKELLSVGEGLGNVERLNFYLQVLFGEINSIFLDRVLQVVRSKVESIAGVPVELLRSVLFSDFLRLLISQLSDEFIPPFESRSAVEFIGWLDIPLVGSPNVIITGMNDGVVPSYVSSDLFLPDNLRRELGITDNTRRIARDVYNLTVILKTRRRENVKLIANRMNSPSRLFFSDEDVLVVCKRVNEFFEERSKVAKRPPIRFEGDKMLKDKHQFVIPLPERLDKRITSVNVTAFKKYKECPYRFYLGNILYLKHVDDRSFEIEANYFGNLIHKVLELFGKSDLRDCEEVGLVRDFVVGEFDRISELQYGEAKNRNVAVDLQFEMAKRRLENFAKKQVEFRKHGWRIFRTELVFDWKTKRAEVIEVEIIKGVLLKGRIDRIDFNEETNQYAVLDYKSSDIALKPEYVHWGGGVLNKDKGWQDFQLPLYYYLLVKSGQFENAENIRLGYFNLPKNDEGGVQFVPENFEIDSAIKECQEIAQNIQNEIFQPINPPPKYDNYSEICLIPPLKNK
ncbi:MAG: PD-(D/E)XK nuclease family protein [Planctomycetaceae bacterium]|jgi:hypothetical protein|nr:PD-(D/E)XK nuclease family protein [Planctomycetaceae bacterium]